MTFDQLSNEAKLLFVIGEPLRFGFELTSDQWINRMAFEWVQVTEKGGEAFRAAFAELAEWINAKTKQNSSGRR